MANVIISQGELKGGKSKTKSGFEYYEFLGVPYAKPPVGDLRFKCPQSPEPWEGVRDATTIKQTNISCQINFMTQKFVGSEDCLYLNVYTPKLPPYKKEKLPVMVFIHGGGFVGGSGIVKSDSNPDFLIEKNVVLVTINYRLRAFGFLSIDIPEAAGNMGLKDQVKALEWVKQNIENFNGDSNNVTLFGSSAGAASVEYLIISPVANGLFHKAILQSGSVLNSWSINEEPKKSLERLLKSLDYKGPMDDKNTIHKYLMNVPSEELILAEMKAFSDNDFKKLDFGFAPIIENDYQNGGAFLTKSPYKLLNDGLFNKVPVIKGFCNKEASLRMMLRNSVITDLVKERNFIEFLPFKLSPKESEIYISKIEKVYLSNKKTEEEINESIQEFLGDLDFVSGIWASAKIMAKAGVPLYVYEFSYAGNLNLSQIFKLNVNGAGHGDESSYLIPSQIPENINESDELMINKMTNMWTNFARTSNPTPTASDVVPIAWPIFSNKSVNYLNIDKELKTKSNYEPTKIAIFEEILSKHCNIV
ncbi:unnamed protein product [Parnassius mnemosyne]|uniref:Carboxylesterase type B domain-containing protein n=1 Tax=Parnassius mnemosyne TaxID=213953 RepID=A0AAV1L781_9NEOP